MLLTEHVDVKPIGNINYYRELGYLIPTKFSKRKNRNVIDISQIIKVKVEDLPIKSKKIVCVKCDDCGKILNTMYFSYLRCLHSGQYFCKSCNRKGQRSTLWKNDISEDERIFRRADIKNDILRRTVLARDNYKCKVCGLSKKLEVHHLDGYNWCKEKRFDEKNAITLCKKCHRNFHLIYGKGNNTKEQFEEWYGKFIDVEKSNIKLNDTKKVICYETKQIYNSCSDYANKNHVKSKTVYSICTHIGKTLNKKHIFFLDEYEKLTVEELSNFLITDKKNKKVVSLESGIIYKSLTDYAVKHDVKISNVSFCCKKNAELKKGAKVYQVKHEHLFYENDYKKYNKKELDIMLSNKPANWKKVLCVTTGDVFDSLIEAKKHFGLSCSTNIVKCCNGERKTAGSFNGEKLQWRYC